MESKHQTTHVQEHKQNHYDEETAEVCFWLILLHQCKYYKIILTYTSISTSYFLFFSEEWKFLFFKGISWNHGLRVLLVWGCSFTLFSWIILTFSSFCARTTVNLKFSLIRSLGGILTPFWHPYLYNFRLSLWRKSYVDFLRRTPWHFRDVLCWF